MRERNIGNPHLGHGRCTIGGCVGSKLYGCGMTHSSRLQAGAQLGSPSPAALHKTPPVMPLPCDHLNVESSVKRHAHAIFQPWLILHLRMVHCGTASTMDR